MTKVFLTGASGFIAKHILRELLEKEYEVRASVRSEKRKAELEALFPNDALEFAFLDLTKNEGWAEAMAGCEVLMHTASPFPLFEPKDPDQLIHTAVDGTMRALNAAKAAGIKRVILTSSNAAIYKDASKPKDAPSDERNWTAVDEPSVGTYEKSKTLAEKAAWDFVAENPDIALTSINPGMVLGPTMDGRYGASIGMVEQMISGKVPMAPPISMPSVDVRDVAMMHVAAIDLEDAKGQRFSATAATPRFIDMSKDLSAWDSSLKTPKYEAPPWLMRALAPFMAEAKAVLPQLGRNHTVSGAKAESTFGFKFIPVREALIASVQSIRAHK